MQQTRHNYPIFQIVVLIALVAIAFPQRLCGQDPASVQEEGESESRAGFLIRVPLPITDTAAAKIEQQIRQVADRAPTAVSSDQRPVLILEFDTSNGVTGQGSELGNCLDIAVLLTSRKLQKLHTVAFVPRAQGFLNNKKATSSLKGHAVLVAMACNEIVMHEEASFGQAGIDITDETGLELPNYENIAGRRGKLAPPLVKALVDKNQSLYYVEKTDGEKRLVGKKEHDELDAAGRLADDTQLSGPAELPLFTSRDMQRYRMIRNRVSSRTDLLQRLDIDPASIDDGLINDGKALVAVQLPVKNYVDSREADWLLRMLANHFKSHPETNFVIIRLNADGGELEPCLRVARELASYNSDKIRTVAYVETAASGATSIIALACDEIVMGSDSKIGGIGDEPIPEQDLEDSRALIKRFAEQKPIDWSIPVGFVDPKLELHRYRHRATGVYRILSDEERLSLDNAKDWKVHEPVDLSKGLDGRESQRIGIASATRDDFEQVKKLYELESNPTELEPSATDKWIESIARDLASPWIAAWLLFGAVFLLSTEMSHPGIGIPGFLGTLCLMLFFWSQYLDGNAHWLEILLFVVGVVFVILEIFVVPGFGIFGIGGLIMIVVGIVLASQTFIIPKNSEELAKLPASLSMVLAASGGFLAGIFFIRKYLTTMPMFRRIMLNPPGFDQTVSPEQRDKRESLVDRGHMVGKTGMTMTPLVPAGKAQIGNELVDVITDGRMIERDENIRVVNVVGNRVIVEPVQPG